MKKLFLILLILLAGCAGVTQTDFKYVTATDIYNKVRANQTSDTEAWNRWKYAGSDDKYDYIYEYEQGAFPYPNSDFHYYKLNKGTIDSLPVQEFKFDVNSNSFIGIEHVGAQ